MCPSHLYGFADHPNPDWSGTYARGDEIRAYLERIVETERLASHLRLGTAMQAASWDAGDEVWRIETTTGTVVADALVLACGRLTEPSIPDIAGLETFTGRALPFVHGGITRLTSRGRASRWSARVPARSSSCPQLARTAQVTLFQRTPAWIVPARRRGPTPTPSARPSPPIPTNWRGCVPALYAEGEARFASRSGDAAASREAQATALAHLEAQVSELALRAALTPDYAFGCKRVLLSDDFYPALAAGDVTLEASALVAVEGSTVVGGERRTV